MKVKALQTCFVDSALRLEGVVFEYNGPEYEFLEPVEKQVKEPKAEMVEEVEVQTKTRKPWTRKTQREETL